MASAAPDSLMDNEVVKQLDDEIKTLRARGMVELAITFKKKTSDNTQ